MANYKTGIRLLVSAAALSGMTMLAGCGGPPPPSTTTTTESTTAPAMPAPVPDQTTTTTRSVQTQP